MKVTAINQQVKRQDRYSIYVDNKYVFSLSEPELVRSGLKIGLELNQQDVAALKDRAVLDKAYYRVLNLISHRPRSEWELLSYLQGHGYDETVTQQTLTRLQERGFVNDLDFARRWVENRRLLKATTKRRLSQELQQKRIAQETIRKVLGEDQTDEREVLRELISRKRKQSKYQDNLKLMQYLSHQGFNYDDIKSVIDEI